MRFILCWAALGGVVFGALTAAWPAHAVRSFAWPPDSYRPPLTIPETPAPIVKVSKKRMPKPKIERVVKEVAPETSADVDEAAEARVAAARYAMAHRPLTVTNESE